MARCSCGSHSVQPGAKFLWNFIEHTPEACLTVDQIPGNRIKQLEECLQVERGKVHLLRIALRKFVDAPHRMKYGQEILDRTAPGMPTWAVKEGVEADGPS